ncbi:MAG: thioredoxin family protein [Pseudomonadota bacterium]|nr:thioredoxin family protein [Pseudomonadota bacterium]
MRDLGFFLVTWLAAALLACAPAAAQLAPQRDNAIRVSLVPGAATPGASAPIAIAMRPKSGWHGYWRNPGDAGAEPTIRWQLPAGVTAGPLRYPVPDRLIIAGLMNYVYERDYALVADLRLAADVAVGTRLPIRARLDYLACTDEICVPESATVATEILVGAAQADNEGIIEAAVAALPRELGTEARFERAGNRLRIGIPLPASFGIDAPYFYAGTQGALRYAAPQRFARLGDMLIVETDAADGALPARIEGVLEYADGQGLTLVARPGDVPDGGVVLAEPDAAAGDGMTILAALAGAILGGLLLNIMPCVFPILSLKALSLARAGGPSTSLGTGERSARSEALAYAAGVILVCLLLGALLLALRAGGESVGWAFQLQDPRVILLLMLLVTAITLNLAGLFDLPSLGMGDRLAGRGTAGAFWTGALAAFIATPCTGPFMGVALGAALVLPTAAALAVFGGLGLGLALPFLALGFIPALRRRLPKPGAWMATFRRVLAIPMALTLAALAWVLARQTGSDGLAYGLGAMLLLALGLWGMRRSRLTLIPAALAAAAAILVIPGAIDPVQARAQSRLGAEPFSEARLAALRAEGRPIFVYFTADWCVTCKVNEKGVLGRADVAASFADNNVAVLVGDWTRGDAAIGRFLERQGRSGVPLYLYYPPGQPAEILPQILTARRLKELAAPG